MTIVAIITAYKPDSGFRIRFLPLLGVCDTVIVVDNTPGGHKAFDLPKGFCVIHNMQNLGLAPALNAGLREAQRLHARAVILFDQDSTPSRSFVTDMLAALEEARSLFGDRCCVGPTHLDDSTVADVQSAVDMAPRAGITSSNVVTCLPTSGITFDAGLLMPDEFFSDEFFLDLVDFEWCWRLRAGGWTFARTSQVRMRHRLGVEERRCFGVTFHVPAPYRHYYQVRDSLRLLFKTYVPTYSKLRLVGILPLKALVYPFILDRGLERLSWMIRGGLDYFRKVRGVGAASAQLSR
jgi:rhamnosyltransferase